jgi:hypothetical protein
MTAERTSLIKDLLDWCEEEISQHGDIASCANTLETYASESGQRRYVHQNFAKSVSCWRRARQLCLALPLDAPVWSVGAGPRLCLLGWFFDAAPRPSQKVRAVDILDWSAVTANQRYIAVRNDVFGTVDGRFLQGRYFPDGDPPPQATGVVENAKSLRPSTLPKGAIVLLPFVLNHLVGSEAPHQDPDSVFAWIEEVRERSAAVIIADMDHKPSTHPFWATIAVGLGIKSPKKYTIVAFDDLAAEFEDAYSETQNFHTRRTGLNAPQFCRATMLLGTSTGWTWLR